MSMNDLTKDVFVYLLHILKNKFYKSVFDGNNDILSRLPEMTTDSPLWMVTGGEAINYYSEESEKTPTKDIDCKLLFVGPYNIPKLLFDPEYVPTEVATLRQFIKKTFPDILLKDTGFNVNSPYLNDLSDYINTVVIPTWNRYSSRYLDLLAIGYLSRQNIIWNCISDIHTGEHMYYAKPDGTFVPLHLHDINNHNLSINEWRTQVIDFKDGHGPQPRSFKLYMMKTPYVDVGRTAEAFPYYCNTGLITDAELSIIEQQLNAFYSNSDLWNLYYRCVTFMNLRRFLISLIGVCILVDTSGRKVVIKEGILDLFIDFSASESLPGKYIYENKSSIGMIPNIIKTIPYDGKIGYIKIPTLHWLIYDQSRMLYHSLRLEEVGHHDWSEQGVIGWKPFEDGKQKKYFSKLRGMVTTYLRVLTRIEEAYKTHKEEIVTSLQQCKDETQCTPSFFISHIYGVLFPSSFITPSTHNAGKIYIPKFHRKITKQHKRKYSHKGKKTRQLKIR